MPGVSGRFSTMVKAKVSRLLDRAEDPAETLDYSYEKHDTYEDRIQRATDQERRYMRAMAEPAKGTT